MVTFIDFVSLPEGTPWMFPYFHGSELHTEGFMVGSCRGYPKVETKAHRVLPANR